MAPGQTAVLPVIAPGAAGISEDTHALAGGLSTLQKLLRVLTFSQPPVKELLMFTVMLDPVALPVMVIP